MDNRQQNRQRPAGGKRPAGSGGPAPAPQTTVARGARAARIAEQVDLALAQAAATMAELGDWSDFDTIQDEPVDDDRLLPLEFQLADLERAVDSMLEARDRFIAGDDRPPAPEAGDDAPSGSTI